MITYSKEYYAQKQKEYRQRNPDYVKRWKLTAVKQRIRDALGNKCFICAWDKNLHIHHKDRKSKNNRRDFKISKINEYILLCSNHHQEAHSLFK